MSNREALPPAPEKGAPRRTALFLLRGLIAIFIILDEIARPLYRPLIKRFAALRMIQRLEEGVARLPRPLVLLALAVPFAIAEPLKLVGVLLMAREQFWLGLVILCGAYLASFLIVERIYHAGREKLLTYRWFAWAMGLVTRLRDEVLGWVRSSQAYGFAMRTRDAARRWWRAILA